MSEWDFNRRWRSVLWMLIGIGVVLFIAVAWDWTRWRYDKDEGVTQWQKDAETRLDTDGDGRVDEVSLPMKGSNVFLIKRDNDADGVLDLQYILRNGIAENLQPIKEPVPTQ